MEVTFALVAITVVLVIGIAIVLLWAVRSGQFEDLEGPAWRVVMDDDRPDPRPDPRPDTVDPTSGPGAAEDTHGGAKRDRGAHGGDA